MLKFDVVSIRPSGSARGPGGKFSPDGYEMLGVPLETSLLIAYFPAPFFNHLYDSKGTPSWVGSENYDLRAKVAPADVAAWSSLHQNFAQTSPVLQRMLRQVLEERCKLRIHSVPTKTDGYALRIGAKSSALVEDSSLPEGGAAQPLSDGAVFVFAAQNGERTYTFYNTSMSVLATYLTFTSQHPVEDRTGLQGRYKFVLRRLPADEDSAPPVPYDLRALGLKVDKEEVPSMNWIVDSIERPSPN
ncbi:TIGR03435 family protein [Terriglobus sp. ADX1]|uniref:TIGR03435 family protein n=1 Tax=Terriglobus sp. ADX1 TaxID=2794063 RepID=UPI002FE6ADB4